MDQKDREQFPKNENLIRTPEEEVELLRKKSDERHKELIDRGQEVSKEDVISEQITDHKKAPQEDLISKEMALSGEEIEELGLKLTPEEHDGQMKQLISLAKEKGFKNALAVVSKLQNPHIEDDFHRFLVAYIKEGYALKGLKEKTPVGRSLNMTLYEIQLPKRSKEDVEEKVIKDLLSSMEQFYAGMRSIAKEAKKGNKHFTVEIALANTEDEFAFYVSVPSGKEELFEKHITAMFPELSLFKKVDDYNIFNEGGESVASYASFSSKSIYPIKTYENFDYNPLNAILSSFSKVDKNGEGAAIQFVINPVSGDDKLRKYKYALKQLQKGMPKSISLYIPDTITGGIIKAFKELFHSDKKKEDGEVSVDESAVENIEKKISSPIYNVNIRIVASSRSKAEAEDICSDIESAFNQFENTKGNSFVFKRITGGFLKSMLRDFSFRLFNKKRSLALNAEELTSCVHFQTKAIKSSSSLRRDAVKKASAPATMPSEGVLLGVNDFQGNEREVRIAPEDRLRHFYVIGQTGTGKSTILKNMAIQDIQNGEGVCMIDPHGSDLDDILATVPKERYEDVIYFDPSSTEMPIGLNMLEYDPAHPEQKTFVVNEMLSIFDKLFDMKNAGGPMFEQYFRNAVLLVMEDPESGNTLSDVSRVLSDGNYRAMKLSKCKNPIVVQYWREIAEKAGGEASLANVVPYITSKFDVFLSNDIMRPIVSQEQSTLNFRDIMDNKKLLFVNLSKGRLGDINAHLLGLIIVGKILMASLSRGSEARNLPPFYLYLDEFQNITTDSISVILSEARKYKLGLHMAHQFIAQLEEKIRDSVFGNVGSLAIFRVGANDAEFLEKQLEPVFSAHDIMNIDNYNAYMRLLINGVPGVPFSIKTLPPHQGSSENTEKLKKYSALKYGRDRGEVEEELMKKYQK